MVRSLPVEVEVLKEPQETVVETLIIVLLFRELGPIILIRVAPAWVVQDLMLHVVERFLVVIGSEHLRQQFDHVVVEVEQEKAMVYIRMVVTNVQSIGPLSVNRPIIIV